MISWIFWFILSRFLEFEKTTWDRFLSYWYIFWSLKSYLHSKAVKEIKIECLWSTSRKIAISTPKIFDINILIFIDPMIFCWKILHQTMETQVWERPMRLFRGIFVVDHCNYHLVNFENLEHVKKFHDF